MMLGDLLARFSDEAVAVEAILSLGDLGMVAGLRTRGEAKGLPLGAYAAWAVRHYADASDEEWTTLLGELARSDDPGLAFLRRALAHAMRSPA